jgi:hypothetical protein
MGLCRGDWECIRDVTECDTGIEEPVKFLKADNFKIELKTKNKDEPAEPLAAGEPLREYFHRVNHFDQLHRVTYFDKDKIHQVTPVLVFDQFEEFFI